MEKYILAIDQGTTSTRAILFNQVGIPVCSVGKELRQIYPQKDFVEHDPMEILSAAITVAKGAMEKAGISSSQVEAIGITNQRETIVPFDPTNGKPLMNAIVWQCRRSSAICEELVEDGMGPTIKEKTGLIIDPYFSATKIQWVFENIPGAYKRAVDGRLVFGTVDAFLLYHLTGGATLATDVTNASRTMLFNIHTMDYDEELLTAFAVPRHALPNVVPSCGLLGTTKKAFFGAEIPITGMAGDQQASLFGHGCIYPGDTKNTYGTGCFLLMNTGTNAVLTKDLITTVAATSDGSAQYALEGSVFVAGAAVKWLRDQLGIIQTAAETETIAQSVSDTGGVYMVPAFTGLGAPHWNMYSRGMIIGINRGTERAHIVRAALEAIAYSAMDVMNLMARAGKNPIFTLKVDGGASANDFLMQFQADMMNTRVMRPGVMETTALGAAYLAGIATGYYGMNDPINLWQLEREFAPKMEKEARSTLYRKWHDAVKRTFDWAKPEE
ncbi:glycerol kinase GlpK [Eubacteriales bacterium OttesenSCG-928-M02]|nr:glycerol kinase GlpK [Eubacteriales bacterium OttesenSCG-928-M02]